MLKAPVVGTVKTRLEKSLGTEGALRTYRRLVEFLLQRIGVASHIHIHYTPDGEAVMENWLGATYPYFPQMGEDLGERLIHAMQVEFTAGVEKLVFLGGDCPYVDQARLDEAFLKLEGHDVVLGPAPDGGYYLIGVNRSIPALFQGILWGSETALQSTLLKCAELGLTHSLLAEESDVDDFSSWEAAREYMAKNR